MDTIMEVFVDTAIGTFSIGVNMWDTVLTMKQKIEKSQCIPVSKQILFFDSKVLDDNLNIMQCQIFHNSHLLLIVDQLLDQTEESPSEPSDLFNDSLNLQAWRVLLKDQVLPQTEPPLVTADSVKEFLEYQALPEMQGKNNQLLHQNEQFSVLSNSIAETIYSQDQLLSDISKIKTKENIQGQYSQVMMDGRNSQVPHQNEQLSVPSNSIADTTNRVDQALSDISNKRFGLGKGKEKIHGQYSPMMMQGSNNQGLHQNEIFSVPSNSIGETIYSEDQALSDINKFLRFECMKTKETIHSQDSLVIRSMKKESLPSNSSEEFLGTQNLQCAPVENKNQELKNEQSPMPVSVKRIINTPDLPVRKRRKINPMRLEVMVQPFQETRKILVFVKANEKVEELRKVLAKMQQMGILDLPEEGYFFIHKQDVLTDNQTFEENLVSNGDTIEIFRGKVTLGGSVPPRTRTFSH